MTMIDLCMMLATPDGTGSTGPINTIVSLWESIPGFFQFLLTTALVVFLLILVDFNLKKSGLRSGAREWQFRRQVVMLLLTIVGLVVVILAVPTEPETRTQLLSLVGVAVTAAIALSSTTFVSNAMAGILLRSISRFRPGDFIGVGEHLGRVTERGLFHTEVQTEDRDLTTLPNFYLISNPIKVVHSTGTIVSVTVSLGYDTSHAVIRPLLTQAALDSGLTDTFTNITTLGDYSVEYKVSGFLEDVKRLVTAPSKLRAFVMDALHREGIEIVSPTFMIQRQQAPDTAIIADSDGTTVPEETEEHVVMFDKAEAAGAVEEMKEERENILAEIAHVQEALKSADDASRRRLQRDLKYRESRLAMIDDKLNTDE